MPRDAGMTVCRMPPPGSCRIWFDGLPPGHQPLPTDCETAYRDAPPDARVLVGDRDKDHGHKDHGHKHDDDGNDDGARVAPRGECLAYTSDGACAEVYAPANGSIVLPDMVGAMFAG